MFCKLIRLLISNSLDSDRDYPSFVRKHVNACPDCRQFSEQSQDVAHTLINDAPGLESTAGLALAPKPVPVMRNILVFAPALICLIIAGLFLLSNRTESVQPEDSEWLIAEVEQLAETTADLLPANPLAREIALITEDSKQAVSSLISCTGLDPEVIMVALLD